jgi:tetratricopeptide (TPR) repeat protein
MQKAIQELEKIVELTPRDERAYYALGGAYFAINKPEKAIAAYEQFQSLSTNADNGYREIAKYYERTGNDDKAIEYLTKGLKIQPDSAESLAMLAVLYSKQNKNKEAIPLYKKLAELTGNNVNVSRDLAAALVENGDNADALKILDDLGKNPSLANDSSLLTLRGKALFGLKKFPEALSIFQSATNDPKAIEARFYIGRVYEETGKYEDEAKVFEQLLEMTAGNADEMKKNELIQKIIASLAQSLANLQKGAQASHAEATHESSKAENKYDTRGLEAAYLAGGQARQGEGTHGSHSGLRNVMGEGFFR